MSNSAKRILVIDGNPKTSSLSQALALHYAQGAEEAGHHVQRMHLHHLQFQSELPQGLDVLPPLEPDLQRRQQRIQEAEHLVWAYPIWWGSVPARLKALLDRLLLPALRSITKRARPCPGACYAAAAQGCWCAWTLRPGTSAGCSEPRPTA